MVEPVNAIPRVPQTNPLLGQNPQLLQTMQRKRETTTPAASRPSPSASSDPLATLRSAQEILRDVAMAAPSVGANRIASEAYLLELQAQQDILKQQMRMQTGTREWFA